MISTSVSVTGILYVCKESKVEPCPIFLDHEIISINFDLQCHHGVAMTALLSFAIIVGDARSLSFDL